MIYLDCGASLVDRFINWWLGRPQHEADLLKSLGRLSSAKLSETTAERI